MIDHRDHDKVGIDYLAEVCVHFFLRHAPPRQQHQRRAYFFAHLKCRKSAGSKRCEHINEYFALTNV